MAGHSLLLPQKSNQPWDFLKVILNWNSEAPAAQFKGLKYDTAKLFVNKRQYVYYECIFYAKS